MSKSPAEQMEEMSAAWGDLGRALLNARALHVTLFAAWLAFVCWALYVGLTAGWASLLRP